MNPGDRQAFEELAYPLLDSAYRTALRMTGQPASAEDLVQEAFLRAFRAFSQFERGTNFKAWLFRILTNVFLNDYRRKGREPQASDFAEVEPADPAIEPAQFKAEDVEAIRAALGDEVSRALDRLPPDFRLPFLLSTFEGFSYKEIASILDIPIGTVMSRLFRARRLLKIDLKEYAKASGYLKDRNP
ncbi:MAG TPA: sigma-70 family RNA polymerase sigma factor [Planctomycetota bacterium]|nr:sigma-70 family RNA polymerase sigma factor [Planctomycetota bacterium]